MLDFQAEGGIAWGAVFIADLGNTLCSSAVVIHHCHDSV